MKKLFLATLILLFLFSSCKKDKEETPQSFTCDIQNPLETIDWLKDIHFTFQVSASPQATKIVQYTYQSKCVYLIDNCVNCEDGGQVVYDQFQEMICEFGTIAGLNTCPNFFNEVSDEVILWGN